MGHSSVVDWLAGDEAPCVTARPLAADSMCASTHAIDSASTVSFHYEVLRRHSGSMRAVAGASIGASGRYVEDLFANSSPCP